MSQDPTRVTTTLLHHAADPFRLLVESVKDYAIYMLGPEGQIASWNTGAERIKGFTAAEVLGQPFGMMFTAEDAAGGKPQRDLDAALAYGRFEEEGLRLRKDGSNFWAINTVTALHEAGRHVGFAVVVRDISGQKRAEEALRWSEHRFRSLATATSVIIWSADPAGNVAVEMTGWREFSGMTEEASAGWGWMEAVHPDDRAGAAERWRAAVASEQPYLSEYRMRRVDGEWRDIIARAVPVRDARGLVVEWIGACVDDTDLKRAERESRASRERFRALVENSWDGVVLGNEKAEITYTSPAFVRMLGHREEELLMRSAFDLIHPDDTQASGAILAGVLRSPRTPMLGQHRMRHRGGGWRWVEFTATNCLDDPALNAIVVNFRDITDQKLAHEALRASEERFRLMVEGVKDYAIYMLDPSGTVVSWNEGAARLFGYTAEEVVGQHHHRFFTPEHVAAGVPEREQERATATGLFAEEGWRVHKNGSRFWAEGTLAALRDDAGKLRGFVRVTHDLTERKRAEEDLRLSEARFRTLITAMSQVVWTTDPTGEQLHTTPPWSDYTGMPPEEVQGPGWANALHPDDRERAAVAWRHSVETREWYNIQYRVRRADGQWRHITTRAVPLFDAQGQVREWVGVCIDDTERRQAELELYASQEQLRVRDRAVQAVSSAVLITDPNQPDNPIIFANPAFEKITGYSIAEAVGNNCRFLQGKDTDQGVVAQIRETVAAGQQCDVELLNYRKDGTPFWNQLTISPVQDREGQLTHFIGIQTDVTERKNLEQQLQQAQKMEAVGRLAGGIAHDFNNMLAVINGYCELLLHLSVAAGDATLRNSLEEIRKAGGRAAGLTRQLLAFSRKQVLEPKILDLGDLVKEMEGMLRRLIGEDIALHVSAAADLYRVKADPGQVEQVLLNLAVNSRDAMPIGGKLTVEVRNAELDENYAREQARVTPGSYVMLAVTDTGCGMTAETIDQIFEPFFTTKAPGQGTGLGLSTVFGIVKQSGGHIQVYSEPSYGTTFKVYFPRTHDRPEVPNASKAVALAGMETVLLVEDEEMVRTLVRNVLEMYGYTVLSAEAGEEALALAQEHRGRLDLLLSDVVMPGGINGRLVAERLKAARPELRVLFMSGYTDDAVVRHGIIEAETAFIQKPFTPLALARKVREVLG